MTLFATTVPGTTDAVRVLSAVGDTFSGQRTGFGMRVAAIAARFTVFRERDPASIAAAFYGGALHRIGMIRVVVPRDASPRTTEIYGWDDPAAGAAIVCAAGIFPVGTADAIRWHREAFDGTGFPDQLRWNSIPETAMTINIARAFAAALDDQGATQAAREALFALGADNGSVFSVAAMREFHEFIAAEGSMCDAPYEPAWRLPDTDSRALLELVCAAIDARNERTAGRGDRLADLVGAIVAKLDDPALDADQVAFAARLTSLARTGLEGGADDIFTLFRLGIESRAACAATAARILATAPAFTPFATAVGMTEEWFDGSGLPGHRRGEEIDPAARVIAVAIAADALTAGDATQRIAAAAGTRFDPVAVSAYLATGPAL